MDETAFAFKLAHGSTNRSALGTYPDRRTADGPDWRGGHQPLDIFLIWSLVGGHAHILYYLHASCKYFGANQKNWRNIFMLAQTRPTEWSLPNPSEATAKAQRAGGRGWRRGVW